MVAMVSARAFSSVCIDVRARIDDTCGCWIHLNREYSANKSAVVRKYGHVGLTALQPYLSKKSFLLAILLKIL